jgi:hypothetical protein
MHEKKGRSAPLNSKAVESTATLFEKSEWHLSRNPSMLLK